MMNDLERELRAWLRQMHVQLFIAGALLGACTLLAILLIIVMIWRLA